jgi:hypothetical protein
MSFILIKIFLSSKLLVDIHLWQIHINHAMGLGMMLQSMYVTTSTSFRVTAIIYHLLSPTVFDRTNLYIYLCWYNYEKVFNRSISKQRWWKVKKIQMRAEYRVEGESHRHRNRRLHRPKQNKTKPDRQKRWHADTKTGTKTKAKRASLL